MSKSSRSERYQASLSEDGQYRLLVENIADYAIYMTDPDGRVVTWNRGAERITQYRADEVIGRHISLFYTDEDKQADVPARGVATAVSDGSFEGEGWRVRKDGSRFWAHIVIDPICDNDGKLVGFARIIRDLSERYQAAERLHRSEEQFRLLVQSVTEYAIFMLDPDGRVTNWNTGAERLKGYRPEEIIGQHYSRFYTEEDQQKGIPERNLKVAALDGRFEQEGWRVRKDGSQFWASVVIDPIRNDRGDLLGFAKVTRDFTERREAQQTKEALFQSQKIQAIGQLTGGVAHDFNNLLMAMLGSLELLRKRLPQDAKLTALLDNAMMAGKRGTALVQRMLMFARRKELHPEATDLVSLLGGMRDLFQRSIGANIRIDMRFPLTLPKVLIDPNQLESAVLNLCLNARDAMPDGGIIVISGAETTHEKTGDLYVRLVVTDTGSGMDERTLARASEPFFTTKGAGKGTGLGLAMVRGLVEESDGRMQISSQLGKGTSVDLWLPVAPTQEIRPEPQHTKVEIEGAVEPLVILAVDDDPLVLLNVQAMLEDLGHTVITANSAAQALEILDRGAQADLLVTDQAMPNMTGIQLASIVREQWPNLPIVIATGYDEMPADPDGDFVKLTKPFFQPDLAKAISHAAKLSSFASVSKS